MDPSAAVQHQPAQHQSNEVCKFYARGDCRFGAKCKKIHNGVAAAPGAGVAGAGGQPGGGGAPRERRERHSSGGGKQPCRFFMSGNCKFGASCKFDHVTVNRTGAALVVPTAGGGGGGGGNERGGGNDRRRREGGPRSEGVCWFFLRGECKNGDSCRFSHSPAAVARAQEAGAEAAPGAPGGRSSSEPCRFFLAGSCSYGQRCNFAHVVPGEETAGGDYGQLEFDEAMYMHQQMVQQQMLHYAQQQHAQQQLHAQFYPQ